MQRWKAPRSGMRAKRVICWLLLGALAAMGLNTEASDQPSLSSHDCKKAILQAMSKRRRVKRTACDAESICGRLPPSPLPMSSRLSPRCTTVLSTYRSSWAELGLSNFVTKHSARPCKLADASRARSPVVVSSNSTATFVLCTVPKAGCTNLRKLLHAIISDPEHDSTDAFGQFYGTHVASYPTVWHYDYPRSEPVPPAPPKPNNSSGNRRRSLLNLLLSARDALWQPHTTTPGAASAQQTSTLTSATRTAHSTRTKRSISAPETTSSPPRVPVAVPTFIVGRNPYVRVLSGFLDKMVVNADRHDQFTHIAVNRHLAFPPHAAWEPSVRDFHSFVRALALRGVEAIDNHFRPAVAVCTESFKYDYYLRLEEMAAWFPCVMEGLGLRGWTEAGWADTPHGRMYVGAGRHFITLNSYGTRRPQRPQWDAAKGRATWGEEGVDWAWVEGGQCWWSPANVSCAEYYSSFTQADGAVVPFADAAAEGNNGGIGGGSRRMHAGEDGASDEAGEVAGKAARGGGGEAAHDEEGAVGEGEDAEGEGGDAGDEEAQRGAHDQHDTKAQHGWQKYYTQEIADLVYFLYSRDFDAFGYERYVVGDRGYQAA
eukprot:jgi/Ulvmu1/11321/UM074_0036.1